MQNATPRVIYLDSVRFDPPPVFTIEDFSVNEHVIAPPQGGASSSMPGVSLLMLSFISKQNLN